MTTLDQRWQTVVPLADGWRWVHNVGATLGQHQHVLDEIWKATPFYCVEFTTLGQRWTNIKRCADKGFVFGWLNNIGPTLGQHYYSL